MDFFQPKYDDAATIYNDLFNRIDADIASLGADSGFGSADMIYGGDTDKWKMFANSLKLRMANRIADADPAKAAAMATAAVAGGVFQSSADNANYAFGGSPNANPIWVGLVESGRADIVVDGDLIYGGDRESWIRFANSLKLRILMLIANVDPSVASEIQNTANQPLITSNEYVAKLDFVDASGNENPIWRTIDRFAGGVNAFWGAGIALVDIMNASNDPRRATYFDDVNGAYVGQTQGVFSSAGISAVSLNIINPSMPDIYATAAETNFYLAEAVLQGWITGDADAHYKAGIQASLDFYDGSDGEILAADKTTFMNSARATITGDDMATAMKKIHEEIYVSNFTRGLAAWTNWRRNKVPNFELPVGAALNTTIRRYQVPLSEITSNPNAPTTLPALDVPMWFEK